MNDELKVYKKMPIWNGDTLPKGFRRMHNTKAGTWARLTVLEGELKYEALDADGNVTATHVFSKTNPAPLVEPQAWHRVSPLSEDLSCYLEFLCKEERYFEKKYGLTAPHSQVLEVLNHIQSGEALDLGSGRGRNTFFLQSHGFKVDAIEKNEEAISKLNKIVNKEGLMSDVTANLANIEDLSFTGAYNLIVSTVVFQFFQPESVPKIIDKMQSITHSDGINLIVAPVSTSDMPCPINFPFSFQPDELKQYYDGWEILKYEESIGEFHKKNDAGDFIKSMFATLIARKP
ncbi:MAG: SAM-dependent methyltransferase TehB [Pseudomonadota bacterium]